MSAAGASDAGGSATRSSAAGASDAGLPATRSSAAPNTPGQPARGQNARSGISGPAAAVLHALRIPPGASAVPDFQAGWCTREDGARAPFLSYVRGAGGAVNWSEELEELHEESSRTHFLDVWTRKAMLARLGELPGGAVVLDVGCSTGYMLEDLRARLPQATLIGVDLVAAGLRKAHAHVPDALLLQADACALPLEDESVGGAVSANLFEHVPDDVRALGELARVLRGGARAVVVVPVGAHNYDYYDRHLGHERRYDRGELAAKARRVGLRAIDDLRLGAVLYPPFWLVKQRNRRRHGALRGAALQRRVAQDIARTNESAVGRLACRAEEALLEHGVRLGFGIRGLTVLERPHGR
jgi:SAM-dependent methyltransferase